VIYNGLDLSTFDCPGTNSAFPQSDSDRGRTREGSKQVICIVSNLRPPKSVEVLLEAFAVVLQSFPETELWIVGDGPMRNKLEKLVQDLHLTKRIVFWGTRSDVPALLKQVTIGVNSSRNEGLPNAIIEYMAAKLPVVATSVGGTPELVTHNETGLLVPPDDSQALADCLAFLLQNPEVATRMGKAGRRRVEEHFTVERMVAETEAVYEALLTER
jgi:glycosyltransferase involved in cell wall biosynthesis